MTGRLSRLFDQIAALSIRTKIAAGVLLLLFAFGGVVIVGVRWKVAAVILEDRQAASVLTAWDAEEITRFLLLLTAAVMVFGGLGAFLLTSLIVNPLLRLARASDAIRAGDLQQRVSAGSGDEVGRLAAAFNSMMDTLARSQGEVEDVNRRLLGLYEDLRRKESQLISAHEDERTRIARELHDEAGQSLTALLLQLGELEQTLPPAVPVSGSPPAKAACADTVQVERPLKQRLVELQSATAKIIQEIRRLMMDLRPTLLDDLGLIPAVRSFAEGQLGAAGVQIDFEVHGEARRLAPAQEIALFRVFQEAITNVKKHAGATKCTIDLHFKESSVAARIIDDGRGFDTIASRGHWQAFGLVGIEERVSLLGGTLKIDSQDQRGTQIALEIPTPPS